VDIAGTKARDGPVMNIDSANKKLKVCDKSQTDKANAMLTREYRKGFELKEIA
jgi:hypothetical protein